MAIYAFTDIKVSDGKKKYRFKCGDEVTGVPQELLKDLLKAGALSKFSRTDVENSDPIDLDDDDDDDDSTSPAPPPSGTTPSPSA